MIRNPIGLMIVMSLTFLLSLLSFATVPVIIADLAAEDMWDMTNLERMLLFGSFFLGNLIFVSFAGGLSDRFDGKWIYLVGLLLTAIANYGFGAWTDDFWTGAFWRFMNGAAFAAVFAPGVKVLSDRLSGEQAGRGVALFVAVAAAGGAVSTFLTGEVLQFGWFAMFYLTAAASVLAAVLVAVLIQNKPPLIQVQKAGMLESLNFGPVMRSRRTMAYIIANFAHNWEAVGLFGAGIVYITLLFSMNPVESQAFGLAPTEFGALMGIMPIVMTIVGNELANKFGRRRTLIFIMLASGALVATMGFATYMPFYVFLTIGIVHSCFVAADAGAIGAGMVDHAPRTHVGLATALFTIAALAPGVAAPAMFGQVQDWFGGDTSQIGWAVAFLTLAVGVWLGPIALWALDREPVAGEEEASPRTVP